jgi:hypothetical protein
MKSPNEAAQWAVKMAETLPEKYRPVAFAEFLRFALLNDAEDGHSGEGPADTSLTLPPKNNPSWVLDVYAGVPEDHVVAAGSNKQRAVWAVIKLHSMGQSATSPAIREIIKTQLGVTPESEKHMPDTLKELTPEYLSRKKEGRGFRYLPSRASLEIFNPDKS